MLYKIITRNLIASIIDAESPEEAMSGFAWAMDSDMNLYFAAIPATEQEIVEYGLIQ